jgi:hypothetical protein
MCVCLVLSCGPTVSIADVRRSHAPPCRTSQGHLYRGYKQPPAGTDLARNSQHSSQELLVCARFAHGNQAHHHAAAYEPHARQDSASGSAREAEGGGEQAAATMGRVCLRSLSFTASANGVLSLSSATRALRSHRRSSPSWRTRWAAPRGRRPRRSSISLYKQNPFPHSPPMLLLSNRCCYFRTDELHSTMSWV